MARRKPTFNYIQKYLWPPTCGFSIKQRSVQCCLSCKRLLFCSVKRGPGTFVATLKENVYSTVSHLQKKVTKGACNQRNDDCNSNWNDGHGHRDECLSEHNNSREEKIHCRPRILTTPDHSLEVSVLAQKNSYVVKGTEVFFFFFMSYCNEWFFPIASCCCGAQTDCCRTISPWWAVGWVLREEGRKRGADAFPLDALCLAVFGIYHASVALPSCTNTQTGVDGNSIRNVPPCPGRGNTIARPSLQWPVCLLSTAASVLQTVLILSGPLSFICIIALFITSSVFSKASFVFQYKEKCCSKTMLQLYRWHQVVEITTC